MKRMSQTGFTLLEVLIALVILSVAFAAMMYSINNSTRTVSHIEETSLAKWVASNVISRAQLGLLNDVSGGSEQQLGRTFYWKVDRKSTPNRQVDELQVQVSRSPDSTAILNMSAYLLRGEQNDT